MEGSMTEEARPQAKIVNLHGTTMMSVAKVVVKDGDIAMTGNIMGTMPGTFYIKPIELWKMVRMVDHKLILAVPGLMIRGRRAWRTERRANKPS
jgi:hypothetical protein